MPKVFSCHAILLQIWTPLLIWVEQISNSLKNKKKNVIILKTDHGSLEIRFLSKNPAKCLIMPFESPFVRRLVVVINVFFRWS